MAVDNVTGIRLGGQTFREGSNYSVGSLLGGLLGGLGLPVSVTGATAQFDITRNRITLYLSGAASALGLPPGLPQSWDFTLQSWCMSDLAPQ